MAFNIGDRIRIKENAFEGSDESRDIRARGKFATIVASMEEDLGTDWHGCWEAQDDAGEFYSLTEHEIELIKPHPPEPAADD